MLRMKTVSPKKKSLDLLCKNYLLKISLNKFLFKIKNKFWINRQLLKFKTIDEVIKRANAT